MIGHDVNVGFDAGPSRVQSEAYDSTTYTAPASRASSSCYSNETVETTVSEPTLGAPASGGRVEEYDEDPERTLVAEGFNFNPLPKPLPKSPLSAHVDPLIIKQRAEVMSGEIRLHRSPRESERRASRQSLDSRRTSTSGAGSKRSKKEDYVVKNLYHATTAHIAASSKRRETLQYPPALPPPKPTPWEPVTQAMSRLSFTPRLLASQKLPSAQKSPSRLANLPFSASTFEVGDRPPPQTPRPSSPPASAFESDDEKQNYMARVFRRSNSAEERGAGPAAGEGRE
ncbi:MAG: hypothetical protein IMZ46_00785, partial [Acidobacteria bacterium]|nr:hypothetical protein [Acidobacteriota bacterium]